MANTLARPVWPFKETCTLTAHRKGQWCKKVAGELRYFGRWDEPQEALKRFLDIASDRAYNRAVVRTPGIKIQVQDGVNHWLNTKKQMLAGNLTPHQYGDYRTLAKLVIATFGRLTLVSDLSPEDFRRLRDNVPGGPRKRRLRMSNIRGIFAFIASNYQVLPRYGQEFESPTKKEERMASRKRVMPTLDQIRLILANASPSVKAWMLLGLNCGMGATDLSTMKVEDVDWDTGRIDTLRNKTGVRRAVILWPETVAALQAYQRPNASHPELVFVTKYSNPLVVMRVKRDGTGDVTGAARSDGTKSVWDKLLIKLKIHPMGFYCLRHVFYSLAAQTGDLGAVRAVMAHAGEGMEEFYAHLDFDGWKRIQAVTDFVRGKIFIPGTASPAAAATGKSPGPAASGPAPQALELLPEE